MSGRAVPDEINIQGILESDTGFRVEVSKGLRAPIVNGQPKLKMCWRADCYVKSQKRRWVFLVTFVDDTPGALFRQLAALSKEGAVPVLRTK